MPRAYPVTYRVQLSMPYQPGFWETTVAAYSKDVALILAGKQASDEGIPLTEDVRVTVERA